MLNRAVEVRPRKTRSETFPAPTGGWVQSGNIVAARPDQAERLDNFIPTAQGARLRGGSLEYADLGASVVRIFSYISGASQDFFGSTSTGLFDLERLSGGTNDYAEVEGLSSGDWSVQQTSTSAGQLLVAVNGTDTGMFWNGSEWNPLSDTAPNNVPFDAETSAFTVGETVTGGTSGASATVLSITKSSATAGTLKVGAITSGPFVDNEALSGSSTGAATANGASSAASAITLLGANSANLSQVWLFKRRLFFVEEGTASFWYLPTDQIGGTLTEFDLGAIFAEGGSLLFGATWSLDSGSGIDDVCIFVSTLGEIAVYEGSDPSSASTWSLSGVYKVGRPLNKHAFFKAGGDLAILTEDGIIPVSLALRKDRAALQTEAISYPIEDAWKAAIANASGTYPVSATLWQSGTLLLIGTADKLNGSGISFAANARTGGWCRIVGWDVRCSSVFDNRLFFGSESGLVYEADRGGSDNGSAYVATYVPKFSASNSIRSAFTAGITYRAARELTFDLYAHADYQIDEMGTPENINVESGSTWGTGVWGTFVWGGDLAVDTYTEWQQVRATGYSLAPAMRVSSNQAEAVSMEILVMRLRSEAGYDL